MIKTFKESVKFLESFIPPPEKKHPGELGFKRMEYLVGLLGNPQLKYPTIHVGGTSGKGSTATIIASILATKYKVGLHTSPHLERITERIKVSTSSAEISLIPNFSDTSPLGYIEGHEPISTALLKQSLIGRGRSSKLVSSDISEKEFVDLVNEVIPMIRKIKKSRFGPPSYFEIITAMAFVYFAKKKVDVAVVEVGMGGRFDATNIIKPLVAVFTNVGLDHTEVLGNTVEEIAKDKVGIIKAGIQVVSGAVQTSVREIIREKCKKERVRLSLLGNVRPVPSLLRSHARQFLHHPRSPLATSEVFLWLAFSYRIKKLTSEGCLFDYFGEKTYRDLKLSLLGEHQVVNASLATRAIELLKKGSDLKGAKGLTLSIIRKALSSVFIPGRLEIVQKNPLVILDGAHNQDKAKALAKAIKKIFPKRAVTAIIAIKNDKNAFGILSELMPICNKVIFTSFYLTSDLGIISSFAPEDLRFRAKKIGKDKNLSIINDPKIAVGEAIKSAEAGDLILVTGSLYLVGEIRRNFQF